MTVVFVGFLLLCLLQIAQCEGAGKALQFSDNIATAYFSDFPGDEFTFEAWLSVSDVCHHEGTILSFAASQDDQGVYSQQAKMNAFVVTNPYRVVACRSYEELQGYEGCLGQVWGSTYQYTGDDYYDQSNSNLYSATGKWRHLAVTYKRDFSNKQDHYKIFIDGLPAQVASVNTTNFVPWRNGTLVLGSDQDCLGGCTSSQQSFYGKMDEIKIWKRVLSNKTILQNFRLQMESQNNNQLPEGLVAYWNFDNVQNNVAQDLSGNRHSLFLKQLPQSTITMLDNRFQTSSLTFKNSWTMKSDVRNMPAQDFTIEFWANTPPIDKKSQLYEQPGIFSFASVDPGNGNVDDDKWLQDANFLFDAISISKHNSDYWSSKVGLNSNGTVSTLGAISLHVNNFEIIFLANWTDSDWHHIAATWVQKTGFSRLYFDHKELSPYAVIPPVTKAPLEAVVSLDPDVYNDDYYYYYYDDTDDSDKQNEFNEMQLAKKHAGNFDNLYDLIKKYNESYVDNYLDLYGGKDPTAGTERSSFGSLVLGQLQRNYGGGFMSRLSFKGALAVVRVWNEALELERIQRNMNSEITPDKRGLVMMYQMKVSNDKILDLQSGTNDLMVGGLGPSLRPSTAPLSTSTGKPVHPPLNPTGGYAMRLHNQVTVIRPKINFPNKALTVEFWMQSTDTCRQGSPFSYAVGSFENSGDYYYDYYYYSYYDDSSSSGQIDDAFLINNYNSWKVRVMNDDSKESDLVGVSATDGNWHYVAVTWRSETGSTAVYQDGKLLYRTKRAKNKDIPANGTLVIGRDQDCSSGCFHNGHDVRDSRNYYGRYYYGDPYDFKASRNFYGLIDEVRLWSRVLSPEEIQSNFRKDAARFTSKVDVSSDMSMSTENLVARWNFDEGSGYVVNDVSGNGNHLYISGEPTWEPVFINSVCGNGILEDLEECDDGNRVSGDGCSARCRVEAGSTCIGSPSVCTKLDFVMLKSSSEQNKHSGGGNGVIIGIVVTLIVLLAVLAVAIVMRQRIYEQFPWLEDKVERVFRSGGSSMWQKQTSLQYTPLDFESLTSRQVASPTSQTVANNQTLPPILETPPQQEQNGTPLQQLQNTTPEIQQNGYLPADLDNEKGNEKTIL